MYAVELRKSAIKELKKLPPETRLKVVKVVDGLANNPRPRGSKKMTGVDVWRVRIGEYRVVYSIEDKRLLVEVIRIAHRREVYR